LSKKRKKNKETVRTCAGHCIAALQLPDQPILAGPRKGLPL
jgi:4'-phosphopantetheinyl transferase EntD